MVQPRRRSLHRRDAALFSLPQRRSLHRREATLFITTTPLSSALRRRSLHCRNAALFSATTPLSSLPQRRSLHRRDAAHFIAATPISSLPRRSSQNFGVVIGGRRLDHTRWMVSFPSPPQIGQSKTSHISEDPHKTNKLISRIKILLRYSYWISDAI